jgi:hypothetical protein
MHHDRMKFTKKIGRFSLTVVRMLGLCNKQEDCESARDAICQAPKSEVEGRHSFCNEYRKTGWQLYNNARIKASAFVFAQHELVHAGT